PHPATLCAMCRLPPAIPHFPSTTLFRSSHFGNGQTSVPYDSQEDIYHNFFVALDSAVTVLEANTGGNAFGTTDQMSEGNVDQWLDRKSTRLNSSHVTMAYAALCFTTIIK